MPQLKVTHVVLGLIALLVVGYVMRGTPLGRSLGLEGMDAGAGNKQYYGSGYGSQQYISGPGSLVQPTPSFGIANPAMAGGADQAVLVQGNPNIAQGGPMASEAVGLNETFRSVQGLGSAAGAGYPGDCLPHQQLSPSELLPAEANSEWAKVNPFGQGDIRDQNFLSAGYHIGVNTVGQSLRNANYGLRSEPPNPQVQVSPWNQSTIEPDLNRKPLEIGTEN